MKTCDLVKFSLFSFLMITLYWPASRPPVSLRWSMKPMPEDSKIKWDTASGSGKKMMSDYLKFESVK